ncbi:MAG: FkbM family methyltransferase [Rhodobacterales bacterium]|nr:MAG: FkbM family methyltransferase [Rhodobacterales bacterium]
MLRSRGLLFPDEPDFLIRKTRRLLRRNDYEAREAHAVRALVGPDDVALELGAGIGFLSTLMARSCKARAVHSFEANPRLIPYIRRVHAANGVTGKVTLTNALLGAAPGKATFYERENFAASSLSPDAPGVNSPVIATHEVEVREIGAEMRRIRPTALVCDIEGAEAEVLPAADLSGLRVAVVELHPQWIGQKGVQAVFDAFHAAGLTFYPKTSNKKVVTFMKGW